MVGVEVTSEYAANEHLVGAIATEEMQEAIRLTSKTSAPGPDEVDKQGILK